MLIAFTYSYFFFVVELENIGRTGDNQSTERKSVWRVGEGSIGMVMGM